MTEANGSASGAKAAGNALTIGRELDWLTGVIEARVRAHFETPPTEEVDFAAPEIPEGESAYAEVVHSLALSPAERLVLILALAPHVRPHALEMLLITNKALDRGFSEFGGRRGTNHTGFLPTLETAAFVLAGEDLERRFDYLSLFENEHPLVRGRIIEIAEPTEGEPRSSAPLTVTPESLNRLTTGLAHRPTYSSHFPAQRTSTDLKIDDLVLPPDVMDDVDRIVYWQTHRNQILDDWGLRSTLAPGYRCLFHGPPGTGKTLTATLIGARLGVEVYRVDLSMIVSKYIGETEKNLARVFDQAESRDWVLFFDEADALFGKRITTTTSNDRFANQEISYLLQRVEEFDGLVVLATNLKANIDEAFARRFQSVTYFPVPDPDLRLRLWEGIKNRGCPFSDELDLRDIAERFELTGGAITNIVRFAAINALQAGREEIVYDDVLECIQRELLKEGKTP